VLAAVALKSHAEPVTATKNEIELNPIHGEGGWAIRLRVRPRRRREGDDVMRLPTWPANAVWNQLAQFQHEINRLFDRWGGGAPTAAPVFPPVNVWEENDTVVLEAELPGLELKDLEIFVTGGNQLTLKGQRQAPAAEKSVWHRQERAQGVFQRSLTLPFPVDPDKVEARLEHGVLTVKLAKHESARPRKIPVRGE
jgi:HSP20 family protein